MRLNLRAVIWIIPFIFTFLPLYFFSLTNSRPLILTQPVSNQIIISNMVDDHGLTNWVLTNTNIVFIFFDPFQSLSEIETPDDLYQASADLMIPPQMLNLNHDVYSPAWKRRASRKGIVLLSDEELQAYSEKAFINNSQLQNKKTQYTDEEAQHLVKLGFEQWDTKVIVGGWVSLKAGYGWSLKNENLQQSLPGISSGVSMNQLMRVNIVGKIGERVSVNINHNSDTPDNEYEIAYKALDTDTGFLRELRAGNVFLNIPQSSRFVKYNGTSKDSYGLKSIFQFGDVGVQTVLNLTTSKKGYKKFTGMKKQDHLEIPDINFVKRRYFELPDHFIDPGSVELLESTAFGSLANRKIDSKYFIRLVEGKDYFVDRANGEIALTNSLSHDNDLVVNYTAGGAGFTTNSLSDVGHDDTSETAFLYLWKSSKNYSQYTHDGYYNLGYQNFDVSRGFSFSIVRTDDKTRLADKQFLPVEYDLYPSTGILRFKNMMPFSPGADIYTNSADPAVSSSVYTLSLTMLTPVESYSLDFGIIPGTERVLLNGRLVDPSDYTLVYSVGELVFNNPSLINDNDTVEISYEYKPFWTGSQKLGVATRVDWKPNAIVNLGGTAVYSISQRDAGAPSVTATPDSVFLGDLDGSLNISRALNMPDPFDLILRGEYAVSLYDPNTADYAIMDDFENSGDSYSVTKNENKWILSAPDTNIPNCTYTNRGSLLYKDYRNYNLDGSFVLLDPGVSLTAEKIKDYSDKPGPYLSLSGHLDTGTFPNVNQTSLIFDYSFNSSESWVGAAVNIAGPSGMDLSKYNEISFWAKIQDDENADNTFTENGNNAVEVYLSAGNLNEDSDGDGAMEAEVDRAQAGYDFHDPANPGLVQTHVGKGRLGQGDGYIQSEDLNLDGVLETNQQTLVFPSPQGYSDVSNILVTEGIGWKKYTIQLRNIAGNNLEILRHVSALSLILRNANGHKGRVLIDSIEFKKVSWSEKRVDGVRFDESTAISGDSISIFNSSLYQKNRFYIPQSADSNVQARATLFEKLHGSKTVSEANQFNEKSLALEYDLTNIIVDTNNQPYTGGSSGYLVTRFTSALKLARYQYMSFYLFVPDRDETGNAYKTGTDTANNETFGLILSSSDRNYYKWKIPVNRLSVNQWHEVKIMINKNLELYLDGNPLTGFSQPSISGFPSLMDVNALMIGTELTDLTEALNHGVIWVNEMYVYSKDLMFGSAAYLNPSFEYKKALLSWGSQEILGPFSLRSSFETMDNHFVASEGMNTGIGSQNLNVLYNTRMLKDVSFSVSYDHNNQQTGTNEIEIPKYLQWNSAKDTSGWSVFYPGRDYIPSFTHSFTESFDIKISRLLMSDTNSDFILAGKNNQYADTAKINLSQNIPVFKGLSFSPRFGWEDSYLVSDNSFYTNESKPVYITNSSLSASRDLKKTLNAGLSTAVSVWNLTGDYSQVIEKGDSLYMASGFREELDGLDKNNIFSRYGTRLSSAFTGFTFPESMLDRYNSESYTAGINGNRPLNFFTINILGNLARTANGYAFDTNRTLLSKSENYSIGNDGRIYFYPQVLFVDSLQFRLNRAFTIGYNALSTNLDYSSILSNYGRVYYDYPLQYNAFFTGASGRTNGLELMAQNSNAIFSSSAKLQDKMDIEWNFYNIPDPVSYFFPKHWLFSTLLVSGRTYNSFYQTLDNQISTTFPLKIADWGIPFLKPTNDFRPNDMLINLGYEDLRNYNDRTILDTITGGASEVVNFTSKVNLAFSYSLGIGMQSYMKRLEDYETLYGFTPANTNQSLMKKYTHSGTIALNWLIDDVRDVKLLFFTLNLRGSSVNNREALSLSSEMKVYDGNNFTRYQQKVFEADIDHSTELKLTDYITGTLLFRTVINEIAEVTPVGNDIRTTYFQPGFGMQAAVDMRIKF